MPANTEVVIREGTTIIASSAFEYCVNLIGQRVNKNYKGVVIVNGKKVVDNRK